MQKLGQENIDATATDAQLREQLRKLVKKSCILRDTHPNGSNFDQLQHGQLARRFFQVLCDDQVFAQPLEKVLRNILGDEKLPELMRYVKQNGAELADTS